MCNGTFLLQTLGGYIVFLIGIVTMGEFRTHIEDCIQKFHDDGKWKWEKNAVIENYYNVGGQMGTKGIQYVLKTNGVYT